MHTFKHAHMLTESITGTDDVQKALLLLLLFMYSEILVSKPSVTH